MNISCVFDQKTNYGNKSTVPLDTFKRLGALIVADECHWNDLKITKTLWLKMKKAHVQLEMIPSSDGTSRSSCYMMFLRSAAVFWITRESKSWIQTLLCVCVSNAGRSPDGLVRVIQRGSCLRLNQDQTVPRFPLGARWSVWREFQNRTLASQIRRHSRHLKTRRREFLKQNHLIQESMQRCLLCSDLCVYSVMCVER